MVRESTMAASSQTTIVSGSKPPVRSRSAEQAGQRGGRDAGGGFELGGGPGGERAADHAMSCGLPGLAGGVETERLARPRRRRHHLDPGTRGRQRRDQRGLLLGQAGTGPQGVGEVVFVDDTDRVDAVGTRHRRSAGVRGRGAHGWSTGRPWRCRPWPGSPGPADRTRHETPPPGRARNASTYASTCSTRAPSGR